MSDNVCTAISLKSKERCSDPVSNPGSLFCQFHASQVHALYASYKKRNGELDQLERNTPTYMPKDLSRNKFETIDDDQLLKKVYDFCLRRYNLTNRCILARELHHEHFYKDTSDFGHQVYLERLQSTRKMLGGALQRLDKRMTHLRYQKESWYQWILSAQKEEESKSEVEKKRIKAAAELYRKHQDAVSRLAAEQVYEDPDLPDWDPIEERIQEHRRGYISLIRAQIQAMDLTDEEKKDAANRAKEIGAEVAANGIGTIYGSREEILETRLLRKGFRRMERIGPYADIRRARREEDEAAKNNGLPGLKQIEAGETSDLVDGQAVSKSRFIKVQDEDLNNLSQEIWDYMESLAPRLFDGLGDETLGEEALAAAKDNLRQQVRSIREFMFLRLVIAKPSMFSAALESKSIEDFLRKDSVKNTDLRDLALALSRSSMAQIRNACSDYWLNEIMKNQPIEQVPKEPSSSKRPKKNSKAVAKLGRMKLASAFTKRHPRTTPKQKPKDKKLVKENHSHDRVKVCGRWLHNYPAHARLPRRGWFQFGIVAPNLSWPTALSLCKSWDEAYELNTLSLMGYFHNLPLDQHWRREAEPQYAKFARLLGFLTYSSSDKAVVNTGSSQEGSVRKRVFREMEERNYICGHVGRADPAARRFIAMCAVTTAEMCVWVRDPMTGKIIHDAPAEHTWIQRQKSGRGRKDRTDWVVTRAMDRKLRKEIEDTKPWHFEFQDYLDVHIWDRHAGRPLGELFNVVIKLLHKAHKCVDYLSVLEPTLETYRRIAKEEDKTEKVDKAVELRRKIKALRKKEDIQHILKAPSPEVYYDDIDMALDRMGYLDNKYWREKENMSPEERERSEKFQEKLKVLEETSESFEEFISKVFSEIPLDDKEDSDYSDIDDSDSEDEYVGRTKKLEGCEEDDGDDQWEDTDTDYYDSESEVDTDLWEDAKWECADLEDVCEEIAGDIFETMAEQANFNRESYEKGRNFMHRLVGKNINEKERKKLEKRQHRLMEPEMMVLPKNVWYCRLMVQMLWGNPRTIEDLELGKGWGDDVDPKDYDNVRDREARAKNPPCRRSTHPPQAAWDHWQTLVKAKCVRHEGWAPLTDDDAVYPKDWVKHILKTVFRLYRQGVIRPSYNLDCAPIFGGRENGGLHMYVDYSSLQLIEGAHPALQDGPFCFGPPPEKGYLLQEMEKWEAKHPGSWYTLYRMKSAQEHWNFSTETGDIDSDITTMLDPRGHVWEWTKMPKDFPMSEYQMHLHMSRMWIEPPDLSGNKKTEQDSIKYWVRNRIDAVLVWGRTETEAIDKTVMAAAYVRKRPAGFDIDFSRSFVGVQAEFLRRLPDVWWD
ncbi:hypothetical protein EDC01DRAFT_240704 [Geopyxis carbonaria]|nr:hypothetical protein EDC01DRAFT_240704 [Geopyxis carbonaria]